MVVGGRVPLLRPPDGEHELLDTGLHRHKEADSAGVGPHGDGDADWSLVTVTQCSDCGEDADTHQSH